MTVEQTAQSQAEAPAPAPTPAAPEAPAPNFDPNPSTQREDLDFAGVEAIMDYDPFKAEPPAAPEAPPVEAPAPVVPTPEPAPLAADPAPAQAPELVLLRQQLAAQQQLIEALQRGQGQGQGQPQAHGPTPSPAAAPMDYNFAIPPQLMTLLDSENPADRQQGYQYLLQGAAQAVHQRMEAQIREAQAAVPPVVQQMLQQHVQAQEVFRDFYGKYPDLNRPELRELISNVGLQLHKEMGVSEWSPQLRDAIAQRTYSVLGKPQPQRPPAGGVPFQAAPAPRAPAKPTGDQIQRDIVDTLFGPH